MKIGPHEVLSELGRGGMGAVYRVRAPDGREAALKVLARSDAAAFARFERERRLLTSLGEEEGFVGLLDSGVFADTPWLLMPLIPGGTLRQRLEAGPLGVEETVALGIQLARALGAAHGRGIVHRDVKPENVLFTASGRPLIADLGLAKHFDASAPGASQSVELSRSGRFRGTAGYVAPEQLEDSASVGPEADVFALGAVLYECLAGRPAFAGQTVLDMLARVASGDIEPIEGAEVPRWLEGLVRRALATEPGGRFADGGALARALRSGGGKERRRRGLVAPLAAGAVVGGLALAAGATRLGRDRTQTAEELVDLAKKRGNDVDREIADLDRAIELDPGLAKAWANRGLAWIDKRGWDRAIADLDRAIALDPRLASAWGARGSARLEKGDRDGAIADISRAIELEPGRAVAWSNRGVARQATGDLDGAIADFTRATELDQRHTNAWVNRGAIRAKRGDWDGVMIDESRAIELDPGLAQAWALRARARGQKSDWDGMIADSTRAIELDPRLGMAWMNRGVARARKGDLDDAIADESRAIELEPGLALAWSTRGSARSLQGDREGDMADQTRAIELDPGLALAWSNLGIERGVKQDWDGDIADQTRAIELEPGLAVAWKNRGAARAKKGDTAGAIADLERSLELESAGSSAEEIRRYLEILRERSPR